MVVWDVYFKMVNPKSVTLFNLLTHECTDYSDAMDWAEQQEWADGYSVVEVRIYPQEECIEYHREDGEFTLRDSQ